MTEQEMLEAQLKVLGHEGYGFTEFRNIGPNKFLGINPRKTKEGTKNEDVSYITCIVIDIDPVREKGVPSTDEQHRDALNLGRDICADLSCSILVDSGSGCHVYLPVIPIQLEGNYSPIAQYVKAFIDSIRTHYGTAILTIDHIQDPARVIRVWGSWNPKSNRPCVPIGIEGIKEFPRFKLELDQQPKDIKLEDVQIPSEERFLQLCQIHPGLNKMMHGDANFESRSEADYAFIAYLTKAHFSLADIKILAKRNPLGRGSELLDQDVERVVGKINADNSISKSFIHSTSVYSRNLENRKPGYNTGFVKLDQMLAGLQRGKLYVIAARTNEGKTSFATQIAYNLVTKSIPVLYFPTELGYEPLFDKIVAQTTGISLRQFQFGNFKEDEKKKLDASLETLKQLPFIVHEDFALTPEVVHKKAREICPQVIIIDYLQAFKFKNSESGKQAGEIAEIMRSLKQLNEELNIPIIVCCQFNRSAIGNELSLAQLKGSGSIEEFSDVVIALSTLSKFEYPRPVDLYVLKSRYSEVGKIRLDFYSTIGKFVEHENPEKEMSK